MLRYHLRLFLFLLVLFEANLAVAQFYNGTQTSFGNNRVQYDNFEWQFYRFKSFEVYFYTGGQELAVHTSKFAHQKIPRIEKFLDSYNQERLQFIIYNKQSHFRQSNIGLSTSNNYNIGGVTNIVGNKIFVYFEGDYETFNQQLEAGIYRIMIYQMLYGGNWRQILRNSALLHIPDWYIHGLISYLTDANNIDKEAKVLDGIWQDKFKRFNSLSPENAELAGHSIWEYVADTYGRNVISNILYMTRSSRNIDDGFLYILGITFEELYRDWLQYYKTKSESNVNQGILTSKEELKVRSKKSIVNQNFKISPDDKYAIFSTNQFGKVKVFLYDLQNHKKIKIFKAGYKLERIQDYSYPILDWMPDSKGFSFITEEQGGLLLNTYFIERKSLFSKNIFKLEKVLSFDYISDKEMVFSGVSKGQSDLYLYKIVGNTQIQLTNDVYDDLNPVFEPISRSIFFTSNRPNDSLNMPHVKSTFLDEYDIFRYRLGVKESPIESVTDTEESNEAKALLTDENIGFKTQLDKNNYLFYTQYDSSITHIDTTIHYDYYFENTKVGAFDKSISQVESNINSDLIGAINFENGKERLVISEIEEKALIKNDKVSIPSDTSTKKLSINDNAIRLNSFDRQDVVEEVNIDNYEFLNEAESSSTAKTNQKVELDEKLYDVELNFPTQRIYRLNFKPDNSILQLNNQLITGQYQVFNGGPYSNPGVGVNSKIGIVDLMEDHRIYGAFRISSDITEYSLSYQNLKKRLDKEYTIGRRKERFTTDFFATDVTTIQGALSLNWPFNEVRSLKGVLLARNDKEIPLSTNSVALERPIFDEYWAATKLAYVFDNTREVAINIRYGTKYKFFAEQYQLVYAEDPNTQLSDLTVFGFDFRRYQKLHKEIIYVGRIAGSKSIGTNPLIYYLGGVDELWKSDIFDENTPIDQTRNYGFQALAANMRGFLQNVRNGNNFVVINQEVRIPIFSYLINRPIQSDFVRNFQIIGFGDVGTAWEGASPYDENNPLNDAVQRFGNINNQSVVTYENINDPVVGGVGFGLRTTLLGYFMRADWGWGIENGQFSDRPLFMFSLSLDI